MLQFLKFRIIVHHYYHHCCASSHFRIKYTRLVVGRTVSVYIYILCTFFLPPINQSSKQSTHSLSFCTVFFDAVFFLFLSYTIIPTPCPSNIYIYILICDIHISSHTFAHCYFYSVSSFFGIVKAG